MDKTFDERATWKDHAVKMREIVCRHIESIHLNDEEVKWMDEIRAAMDARRIRSAVLAQAQEPVAWFQKTGSGNNELYEQVGHQYAGDTGTFPLYAAPADGSIRDLEADAKRWQMFCDLWCASTEMLVTQDDDGRWSISIIEAAEGMPMPGKWTGADPDAAIDATMKGDSNG